MSTTTIFLFPGQSSAGPAMFGRAMQVGARSPALVAEAGDALGVDLARTFQAAPRGNWGIQVSVFVATMLHLHALRDAGVDGDLSCGMSLGEYAHLVHIGALDWLDALQLVSERGRAYDDGPAGQMVSVFPVPDEELAPLLTAARAHGRLFVSNHNSPTQHVLAGDAGAVAWAVEHVREELCSEAIVIEDRIPIHCELFAPVGDVLHVALRRAPWRHVRLPYVSNVDAMPLASPTAADFVDRLTRHVSSPVRWRQTMEQLRDTHPGARFVEVGPGRVLHNMLRAPWMPVTRFATDDDTDPVAHFRHVARALGGTP